MSQVAAIVLAAGQGARFGPEPKLLALLDGKPLVWHVAEAAVHSLAKPVIVVTGHKPDEVEASIRDLPVRIIRNSRFAEGLSTSLKAGFAALPPEAGAAIILLGDMPFITASLIDELASAWQSTGRPAALIPTSDGRRGNPVVLSRILKGPVSELSGDAGAGRILRVHPGVVEWPIKGQTILQDVDTPEALRRLQAR